MFMCPYIHLVNRNKFQCTAKLKYTCMCFVKSEQLSSLDGEEVLAEQFQRIVELIF